MIFRTLDSIFFSPFQDCSSAPSSCSCASKTEDECDRGVANNSTNIVQDHVDPTTEEIERKAALIASIAAGIVGVVMLVCVIATLLWRNPDKDKDNGGDGDGHVQLQTLMTRKDKEEEIAAAKEAHLPAVSSGDPVDLESSETETEAEAVSLELEEE